MGARVARTAKLGQRWRACVGSAQTPPRGGQSDRRSDPEVFTDSWRSSRFSRDKFSSALTNQAIPRLLLLRETDVSNPRGRRLRAAEGAKEYPGGREISRGGVESGAGGEREAAVAAVAATVVAATVAAVAHTDG